MKTILSKLLPLVLIVLAGYGVWTFFISEKPDTQWEVQNFPPASGSTWVAFGDSLYFGAEVPRNETWPHYLGEHYGVKIINSGINGDTTSGGLNRVQSDVLAHDPEVVFLGLGGNDMLRRQGATQMGQNLERLIDQIQASGALVILTGHDGKFIYGSEYREEFERVAREKGCVYVDSIMDGIIGNRSYLLADNLHPNGAGYRVIADRVIQECDPWLSVVAP